MRSAHSAALPSEMRRMGRDPVARPGATPVPAAERGGLYEEENQERQFSCDSLVLSMIAH
jgi:hypothetical protein